MIKSLFVLCSACCFLAILHLPIGYYTFLRIIISIGALAAMYHLLTGRNYAWVALFAIVLFLFNPLFPFYLYRKSIWIPIDILVGLLFLWMAFLKRKSIAGEPSVTPAQKKVYTRDRIITSNKK